MTILLLVPVVLSLVLLATVAAGSTLVFRQARFRDRFRLD